MINNIKPISFLLFLGFVFTGWLQAQEPSLSASAPNVVRQGQQFQLSYVANDDISQFQLPEVDGLTILGGPSQSTSTSIQIINGKTQQSKQVSYSYFVRFDKTGKFTIPAATAKVGRKQVQSNALNIEVLAQSGSNAQQNNAGGNQNTSEAGPKLFMRLVPSKRNVYVGEPIAFDLKLYTRVKISDIGRSFKEADFNSFFKEDLKSNQQIQFQTENYNNEIYNAAVIKRYMAIPTKPGKLKINPFELDVEVVQQGSRRSRSPFDDFFGTGYNTTWINVVSEAVYINAKPLPANQPEHFNGAVGRYDFAASLKGDDITTNDAVSLKLTVKGAGNLKLVNEIPVDIPPTFEKLEPQIASSISETTAGHSGSKTFTYTFIPRSAGSFTIPEVHFTYFDVNRNKFITHTAGPYQIKVRKGEGDENLTVISGVSKEDVKYIGKDIRFIKTSEPSFLDIRNLWISKSWYWAMYAVLALAFSAMLTSIIVKEKENKNVVLAKNKKANKLARKKLQAAKKIMKSGDDKAFYAELLQALWGYMSDKLIIPVSDLSVDKTRSVLLDYGVPETLVEQFTDLTQQCEFARYAPSAGDINKEELYANAVKTIVAIEGKLK